MICINNNDISLNDILGREIVSIDTDGMCNYVAGKVILVTGGGGSIGSELCRQLMRFLPQSLVIVDAYESNAYEIQEELTEAYPDRKPIVFVSSVCDKKRMAYIFSKYKPHIVFHAAAYKHVPLMELNPAEAVNNNIFGTYNIATLSVQHEVDKFILISTDKAVNPTSVMGATKRFCEMLIQGIGENTKTKFASVRFGNVICSNGSVIPLFKRQIERGGPLRVTHRNVTRFFMTISEAVSLVIQAGYFGKNGEIYVLDMGEPIRIYDLAERLIRLSGYTPGVDIKIELIGLRPGEKLFEELTVDVRMLERTQNDKIFVEKSDYICMDEVEAGIAMLKEAVEHGDDYEVITALKNTVSTYER